MPEDEPTLLSVTVSVSPRVELTQYQALKPHASVTIGIPPTGLKDTHLEFATKHLRRAIFAALLTEIEVLNDTHENLIAKSEDTTKLAQLCMKEIGNVAEHPTFKVSQTVQALSPGAVAQYGKKPVLQGTGVPVKAPVKVPVPKAGGVKGPTLFTKTAVVKTAVPKGKPVSIS